MLHIGQVASVQAESLSQLYLRPAALLSQSAKPSPKPNANVVSHESRHDAVLLMDDKATLSNTVQRGSRDMGFIPDSNSATVRIGARWQPLPR